MVSKGVKKSSAVEVKSSKADDSKRKIFDKSGSPKKVANNKTTKSKRPYKYNTPMKELVSLLEQYKKDNNPLADELEAVITKKRAQWKKFYNKNKVKYKQWSKNWRDKNPDKVKEYAKRHQQKLKEQKAKEEKANA